MLARCPIDSAVFVGAAKARVSVSLGHISSFIQGPAGVSRIRHR